MKTTAYYLFLAGVIVTLFSAAGQLVAEDHSDLKSKAESIASDHPWNGKHVSEIKKQFPPEFQIEIGTHQTYFVFRDHQGKSIMFDGHQIKYFDLKEFVRKHELLDIQATPKSPDTEKCFCYKNRCTGDLVRLLSWRVAQPGPNSDATNSGLNELNLDWKANRFRSII